MDDVRQMLSVYLKLAGFNTMAKDVLLAGDADLIKYATVIVKTIERDKRLPPEKISKLKANFKTLGLLR